MFTRLSEILPKTINKQGLRQIVSAMAVCRFYSKIATEIIHKEALLYTQATVFKNGTLIIGVSNPAWAEQVVKNAQKLLWKMAEEFGDNLIKKIQTRVYTSMEIIKS